MESSSASSAAMVRRHEKESSPERETLTSEPEGSPASILSGNDSETNWRLIIMACVVMFLGSIEGTVIGQSEWPYMKEIDKRATSSFFGLCTSFSQLGHAIFAILFSYWTYKTNSVKGPLQAGRILAQLAGTLYLCVELFPQNRRFVMMTCYICFGIASSRLSPFALSVLQPGSATVMRVYMVYVSSKTDRVKAYSCMSLAGLLSVIIGPLCQMLFAMVPYPGWQLIPGIAFNIYSAPIWMAWCVNAFSMLLIHYRLEDIPRDAPQDGFDWTWKTFKQKLQAFRHLDVSWWLILLLWLQKANIRFSITTIQVVSSPMQMSLFDLDGQKTVLVGSASAAIVGVLAAGCVLIAILTPCTNRISPRVFFFVTLVLCLCFYLVSYPYPFDSHPLSPYNATSETGCDPTEYSWCHTAQATSLYAYQVPNVLTNGIGFTLGGVAIDTIYSKVLGNVDQTLLQGAIVVVDDAMSFLGPIYASMVFTSYGQYLLWIVNFIVTAIVTVTWIVGFKFLRDYQ